MAPSALARATARSEKIQIAVLLPGGEGVDDWLEATGPVSASIVLMSRSGHSCRPACY